MKESASHHVKLVRDNSNDAILRILDFTPPKEQIVASRPAGQLVRTCAALLIRRRTMSLFLLYESNSHKATCIATESQSHQSHRATEPQSHGHRATESQSQRATESGSRKGYGRRSFTKESSSIFSV